jgi:hypothetical protein
MGSFIPVAFQVLSAFTAVSSAFNAVSNVGAQERQNDLALEQLREQQRQQQQISAQDTAFSRQEIALQTEKAESERRAALKRAVARQRAEFGGSGISSGDGSSEAVLLGLFAESEEEKANRQKLDNIKLQTLDQNLANQSRINTLTRTQLSDRQKLTSTSSTLDEIGNVFSVFQ